MPTQMRVTFRQVRSESRLAPPCLRTTYQPEKAKHRSEWTRPEAHLPLFCPLGRGRFTRLPAPLTYALPTPPPPHDYPCLAHSYIHHRPPPPIHTCSPNVPACCVLGQGFMPINFQLRVVGGLTFPVKKLFQKDYGILDMTTRVLYENIHISNMNIF